MKREKMVERKVFRPKFDRCVLLWTIISAVVVVSYIATDHLPAWTPVLGTIFEIANGFALSFLVTTIFYYFTVYRPQIKRYEDVSKYLIIDKKSLDASVKQYSFFVVAHAMKHSSDAALSLDKIDEYTISRAQKAFAMIPDEDPVWENIHSFVINLVEQLNEFLNRYDEYISIELRTAVRELISNSTFYIIQTPRSNRIRLLKTDGGFCDYYHYACNFLECKDLMVNAKEGSKYI